MSGFESLVMEHRSPPSPLIRKQLLRVSSSSALCEIAAPRGNWWWSCSSGKELGSGRNDRYFCDSQAISDIPADLWPWRTFAYSFGSKILRLLSISFALMAACWRVRSSIQSIFCNVSRNVRRISSTMYSIFSLFSTSNALEMKRAPETKISRVERFRLF